jgi:hypothetical protein
MIVLAYLWPLALIPLLVEKRDREVQWHARHGLVLMGAELLLLVVMTIGIAALSFTSAPLGCALSLGVVFIWAATLALHVVAMVKGLNGKRVIVPGVSHLASRF